MTPTLASAPLLCPQGGSWSAHSLVPVKSCHCAAPVPSEAQRWRLTRIGHHEHPEEGGVWDEGLWVPWPEVEELTGHSPLEVLEASPSRWVSGPGSEPQPTPPLGDVTPAEREPSPGFSQGNCPGSLRTLGPSPHTLLGCQGESSPSREIGKTRKRLNQGCDHVRMGQQRPAQDTRNQ